MPRPIILITTQLIPLEVLFHCPTRWCLQEGVPCFTSCRDQIGIPVRCRRNWLPVEYLLGSTYSKGFLLNNEAIKGWLVADQFESDCRRQFDWISVIQTRLWQRLFWIRFGLIVNNNWESYKIAVNLLERYRKKYFLFRIVLEQDCFYVDSRSFRLKESLFFRSIFCYSALSERYRLLKVLRNFNFQLHLEDDHIKQNDL